MMKSIDKSLRERLLDKLYQIDKKSLSDFHVVLLPDFFVDHFLYLDEFESASDKIKSIYSQGGGNLPGVSQRIHHGGNATNTALALARLGITTHLICMTDKFGLHLLRFFLGNAGVNLSGVKTDGRLAITTAMEFGKKHVNVMVGDAGSVSDFSFDNLDEHDLQLISRSDVVCVLNWNLNRNGTELAQNVFRFAKQHKVKTFFDSGDPSPKSREIPELRETVLRGRDLDVFSLNENELGYYSDYEISDNERDLVDAAVSLKKQIHARIDLHTSEFACTVADNYTVVPTLKLSKIARATGAGDAWNAGIIFGDLSGFDDDERLLFSNVFAARYISSSDPVYPNLDELMHSIKKTM